jgi:hypothetical protein
MVAMTAAQDSQVQKYLTRLAAAENPSSPIYTPGAEAVRVWYELHPKVYPEFSGPAATRLVANAALGVVPIEIFMHPGEAFAVYLKNHPVTGQPHLYTSRNVRVRYDSELNMFYPGGLLNRMRLKNWSSPILGLHDPVAPYRDAIERPWFAVFTVPRAGGRYRVSSVFMSLDESPIEDIVAAHLRAFSGRS